MKTKTILIFKDKKQRNHKIHLKKALPQNKIRAIKEIHPHQNSPNQTNQQKIPNHKSPIQSKAFIAGSGDK